MRRDARRRDQAHQLLSRLHGCNARRICVRSRLPCKSDQPSSPNRHSCAQVPRLLWFLQSCSENILCVQSHPRCKSPHSSFPIHRSHDRVPGSIHILRVRKGYTFLLLDRFPCRSRRLQPPNCQSGAQKPPSGFVLPCDRQRRWMPLPNGLSRQTTSKSDQPFVRTSPSIRRYLQIHSLGNVYARMRDKCCPKQLRQIYNCVGAQG